MDVTRAVCNIYAYLNAGYYIICMRRGGGRGEITAVFRVAVLLFIKPGLECKVNS